MQRAVILTDKEYEAIPLNAAGMIVRGLKSGGFKVLENGAEYERLQDFLCGILAADSELLTVPWKRSRFNPEREVDDDE